jgi:DNA-binding NarL/FixJ family response regulator
MIRVLAGDDHPIVLEGVERLLSKHEDLRLAGQASTGPELVDLAKRTLADVVLLDISMPGPGFASVIKELRADHPRLAILVLSGQPPEQYAVRVLRAGANGFVSKDSLSEELADAIRQVADGGRYVSSSVTASLVDILTDEGDRAPHELLSDREFDVLRYTALGKPVKQIAKELGVSPKTVSTYRRRILDKLRVDSQAEAIRYAISHGIVTSERSVG